MRRRILLSTIPAALLAGCGIVSTTTTGGVTTVTINVAKFDAYGQAWLNAANLLLALPGASTLPVAAAITAVIVVLKTDLAAFDAATKGQATLTFDATSVPAAIQSLLADGKSLLADAQGMATSIPATASSTITAYIDAISTVVSLFAASLGTMGAAAPKMTEAQALATLGVR